MEISQEMHIDKRKFEYVGDAVLSLVLREYMVKNYSHLSIGETSYITERIVSNWNLSNVDKCIDVAKKSQQGSLKRAKRIEIGLGKMYLHYGLAKSMAFIHKHIVNKEQIDGLASKYPEYVESQRRNNLQNHIYQTRFRKN